jgi:hypothetical protein
LTEDAVNIWLDFLAEADAEMSAQNTREYIKNNHYPPTIHDIVKVNANIKAERDKKATQLLIQENARLLETVVAPPWEREGLTQREWMARILERKGATK